MRPLKGGAGRRPGAVADLALDVQDLGDALEADRGLGQRVRHLREVLHRLVHLAQVEDEDEQGPGGQTAVEHEPDAVPEHETGADRDDDVDQRGQPRLDTACAQAERDTLLTLLIQALLLEVLPRERLDDADG